ncbi:MAG: MFS transporter, partial [Abitibacteriaceae bacterium]|nr:MFS transporter [Abditibacteriaceae bacterium]
MAARINQAAPHPVQDLPTTDKHYPPQTAFFYFQLSIFWFALSFLWAGMITIVIQNLVAQMTGNQKDLYLGWTLAIGAFVSTIIGLLAGTLSDRSRWKMGKRRPYMIVGTLCVLPALFWLAHVHSIPALMVDFCLIQFWTTLATSPYQALVPDLVPKERQGTASAYMGMGSLLGQLGGLILCGLLITKPGGLAQIMYTLMILLTGAMLFTVWRVPEVSAASPSEGTGSSQLLQAVRDSFRFNAREHPDFFRLIASRFIINMGFYSATEFLLYYVQDSLHTPQPKATAIVTRIFVITTVSGLLGNFPAGILSDRISKKKVVYASTILTGVAALVFLLTTSITV